MGARDRRQADALDRSWDALLGRAAVPVRAGDLDPSLAEVLGRLAALDRADAIRRDRAPTWTEVAGRIERESLRNGLARRSARTAANRRRRSPARWWPALEFAAALSLIVALFGFAMGWHLDLPGNAPSGKPTPAFGAVSQSADSQSEASAEDSSCEPPAGSDEFPELEGSPRWDQRDAVNHPFVHVSALAAVDGLLFIGGSGDRGEGAAALMAVDAVTGEMRWWLWLDPIRAFVAGESRSGGTRVTSILTTPKLLFAATDMGLVSALNPTTGEIVRQTFVGPGQAQSWTVELGLGNQGATVFVAVAGSGRAIGLSVTEEMVLVTPKPPDGYLAALSAGNGAELWEVPLPSEHFTENVLEPRLLAYDPATGELRWRIDFADPLPAPAVAGDGAAYVTTSEGETVAFELADGAERWRSSAASAVWPTPLGREDGDAASVAIRFVGNTLAYSGGTVFVAGANTIAALDPVDGTALWCSPVGAVYHLTVDSGILFAATPAGIFAIDAESGAPLWFTATWTQRGAISHLYPAAYGGSLYIREWMHVVAYDLEPRILPSAGGEAVSSEPRPVYVDAIPTIAVWSDSKVP